MTRRRITYSSHSSHRARFAHARGARQFRTYDTTLIRPRRSKGPMVLAGVFAVVVIAVLVLVVSMAMRGCTAEALDGSQVVVSADIQATVPEGSTAQEVAALLESAGVVPSGDDFLTYAKSLGVESQFQAGTYLFSTGMTLEEVVTAVATGDLGTNSFTIPEGYTLASSATLVEEATEGAVTADEFTAAASDASAYADDYDFLADAPSGASLEGFLFPLTYSLTGSDTADSLIRMMLDQFETQTASLDWSYPQSQGLTIYEAVNLASIVEKESSGDEQIRAQVAAVFYNRLSPDNTETNGYLQSDATTAYEVGHDPSAEEVQTGTYSTYANPGLPITPICSPSLACLEAVCAPASDYEDYYYFIFWTNDEGETEYAFSKTYAEHLAAIEAYL